MISTPPQARRIFVVALLTALTGATIIATVGGGPGWGMIGNDSANSRSAQHERTIGPENVSRLMPKWIAPTTGDVSGTASAGKLNIQFSGSLTGSLEMSFSSSTQSVSVSVGTKGAGIKGVQVSLNRK